MDSFCMHQRVVSCRIGILLQGHCPGVVFDGNRAGHDAVFKSPEGQAGHDAAGIGETITYFSEIRCRPDYFQSSVA
jgi:hypothetical protein